MPKEVSIVESAVPLMDPAGKDFQDMLRQSQETVIAKLNLDTSMVEGEKKPVIESETEESEDIEETKETPEVPGDDIGNLKHKVSGLQAELARVRKQKSGSADEVAVLRERIADTEGQLKVLRDTKTASTVEDKLAKLTDDQIADNTVAWEDELADARVTARMAERDSDTVTIKDANTRISTARSALKLYANEERRRLKAETTHGSQEKTDRDGMAVELDTLFTDLYTAAPDLNNKTSAIWKAGQKEYAALPRLTKALGPLGELVAVATAIAKNPQLIGKNVITTETGKVLDAIEKGADKAFQKGGAAPTSASKIMTTINSQADHMAFEAQVRAIKGG